MPITETHSSQNVSTRAFCIANNVSTAITEVTEPWKPEFWRPVPDFGTKTQYRQWAANPATQTNIFTMIEADNSAARAGGDNPPMRVHGIVADYDAALTDAEIAVGLNRQCFDHPVYAWNRTFSGGLRVVWRFEQPIFFYSRESYKRLVAKLRRELHIGDIAPGLDEAAIEDPHKLYVAGDSWTIQGGIIRAEAALLWSQESSERENWAEYGNAQIPLDQVKAEIDKKWGPDAWIGEFALGARGVRFWEGGTARSVLVRETGLTCFTGDKNFITWSELLGKQFVAAFLENRIGAALKEIYFDGRSYWRKLPGAGHWCPMNVEMTKRHLLVNYGLNPHVPKGDKFSEIDSALHRMELTKFVHAALPFPCNPKETVSFNGKDHLNISATRAVQPCADVREWSEGFPFVSSYLSQLFLHENGFLHVMAWLKHAYEGALKGSPDRGYALFIAGPPGTGKTLFSRAILGAIFGGCADASACLVDGVQFNDSLFENFIWAIDDSYAVNDAKAHARYSTAVKAVVANPSFRYSRKFGAQTDIPFNGRLVITLNDDAQSLEMLPNLEASLSDKILVVRTNHDPVDLPCRYAELDKMIASELPSFLRWLLDWEPPVENVGELGRFGYAAYQDEQLIEDAREESASGIIGELVHTFRTVYKLAHPEATQWVGSTTELLSLLANYPETQHCCPRNAVVMGRQLRQAVGQGLTGVERRSVKRGGVPAKCWIIEI